MAILSSNREEEMTPRNMSKAQFNLIFYFLRIVFTYILKINISLSILEIILSILFKAQFLRILCHLLQQIKNDQ